MDSLLGSAKQLVFERVLAARGKLVPRAQVPWLFWVVAGVHVLMGATMLLYPLLFPRQYDGWCLLVFALVVLHWLLLCGECILSVFEKKLLYQSYSIGEHPLHQWFMDVFSTRWCVVIMLIVFASWTVALTTIFLRNLTLRRDEVTWRLWFAGTDRSVLLGAAQDAREIKAFASLVHEPFVRR